MWYPVELFLFRQGRPQGAGRDRAHRGAAGSLRPFRGWRMELIRSVTDGVQRAARFAWGYRPDRVEFRAGGAARGLVAALLTPARGTKRRQRPARRLGTPAIDVVHGNAG